MDLSIGPLILKTRNFSTNCPLEKKSPRIHGIFIHSTHFSINISKANETSHRNSEINQQLMKLNQLFGDKNLKYQLVLRIGGLG
jgi:hypothetical protein